MKKVLFYLHRIQDVSVQALLIRLFESEEIVVQADLINGFKGKRDYGEKLLGHFGIDYLETYDLKEKRDEIGMVITSTESSMGPHKNARLLVKQSGKYKIPTLTLQHGITHEIDNNKPIKFYSDLIALWGLYQRDFFCEPEYSFLKKGIFGKRTNSSTERKRFVVTGAPKFDDLFKPKEVEKKNFGVPEGKRVVSVFTNTHWAPRYSAEENIQFFNELETLVKSFQDIFWIFKLHPDEKPETYHSRFYPFEQCRVIYPREGEIDIDTQDILRISDAVIMALSTVALEAAILKKPVISLNYTDKPGYRDLLEYHDNLKQVLTEALEKPELFIKRQQAFSEGYHAGKGNAANYLKEMIVSILKGGKSAKDYYGIDRVSILR
jgi:hypothetical protein